MAQIGYDLVVEQSIYEASTPSLGYGPQNPHLPLLTAQLNEANISGWLAAGYHADDVAMYLKTVRSVTSHPSLLLDLRYVRTALSCSDGY
jgi:hypothetical protein